jgi:hypothetical protein
MSYDFRDCSNGSRRRLTNIPAGKPGGVTGGLGLHSVMEGVGSCSRLVRQVNSTRSSALPLPAGLFLARKSPAGVTTATASPRECTQRPPEGHLGRVIAFR